MIKQRDETWANFTTRMIIKINQKSTMSSAMTRKKKEKNLKLRAKIRILRPSPGSGEQRSYPIPLRVSSILDEEGFSDLTEPRSVCDQIVH